jgi:hypothetical protein
MEANKSFCDRRSFCELDKIMSRIRFDIEWSFGSIIEQCKFIQYKHGQQLQKMPLTMQYHTAVLLANCRACMYGAISCSYFDVPTPSLDEDFNQKNVACE